MKKLLIFILIVVSVTGCENSPGGKLIFVEPDIQKGFQYPYFLFIPENVSHEQESFIIIEPNNSGFASDELDSHIEKAKRTATKDFYIGNFISHKLNYPLIVPVFPRPESQWKVYTHALDRDVMIQKNNSLERIDKQLIEMFNDARSILREQNINTKGQFLLTGFSASGTFANRFTILHPEKVFAVAAGGLNGLLILPLDSIQDKALNYPIGTNDLNEFLDTDFQKDLFIHTPQLYFMGISDDNDAVPYDDAFDPDERELIYFLMGEKMLPERWEYCKNVYGENGVNSKIMTYQDIGHEHPEKVKSDITEFFRSEIERGKTINNTGSGK